MQLRPFQEKNKKNTYDAWDRGCINVLSVLPTGGGKTVIFSDILKEHNGPSCAIAHRQELVTQISLALARDGVRHRIIGPNSVIRLAVNIHMGETGRSYYDPSASCAVAGVDTLVRRHSELSRWCNSVTLWVQDECHHLLKNNKWGKAVSMFPNAKGLGVTATPTRADGKGLGRHADGLIDEMIVGPSGRELIEMGYLTDYRIFAPPSDLDLSNVTVSQATGDFNPIKLKTAIRKSRVIGDVVKHYLKIAPGKLGITFATDVETAKDIAAQFNASKVPAEVVTAKTPNAERINILRRFKNKELLQLVNVDLFGEGFDLPAIEVVSMARPTESFALFCQQFGRSLRLMISDILSNAWGSYTNEQRRIFIASSEKPNAIIIDHVGNIQRHGLPDASCQWSLDRRVGKTKLKSDDAIPMRGCPKCMAAYERIYKACPFCGYAPIPSARSGPEFVDGDLTELDPATLAIMRGDIDRINMDSENYRIELINKGCPKIGQMAHVKRHIARQEVQEALQASIAWWGGLQRAMGRSDSEGYRRFYFKFGIDVLNAQKLNSCEALELAKKINHHLGELVYAN